MKLTDLIIKIVGMNEEEAFSLLKEEKVDYQIEERDGKSLDTRSGGFNYDRLTIKIKEGTIHSAIIY